MFEKVKSGLMALLFTTCLIMAGLILYDGSLVNSNSATIAKAIPQEQLSELLNPQSCAISFGGGLYKGVYSVEVKQAIWLESKKYLKNYLEFTEMNKIAEKDWDTAVKSKSVSFVMPFEISLEQMKALLMEGDANTIVESPTIDTIVVPVNEDDMIYVANTKTNVYFQLKGVKREGYLGNLVAQFEKDKGVYDSKTAEELYGLSKVLSENGAATPINNTLLPIATIPSVTFVRVEDEMRLSQMTESQLKAFVGKAFGARNDFMKTLEDIDGSLVYLYGYNDRALKIGSDGYITYNRRYDAGQSANSVSFKDGLKTAYTELGKFGTLPKDMYLSHFERFKDKEGNWVNRFGFNYPMQGLPLYLNDAQSGDPLVVELTGQQVTSIKRKVSQFVRNFSVEEIWSEPMSILDIIELNYDRISNNYAKFDYKPAGGKLVTSENSNHFAISMLQAFSDLDMVYYQDKGPADSLVPAWRLRIGSCMYIVNLYSGEILKEVLPEGGK